MTTMYEIKRIDYHFRIYRILSSLHIQLGNHILSCIMPRRALTPNHCVERRETQPLAAQMLHARGERQRRRLDGGRNGISPPATPAIHSQVRQRSNPR